MNSSRWQQIEDIFQKAVDLAPKERAAFLMRECRNDADLKNEVEKLLANYDSADSFIESPVWTDSFLINSSAKKAISDSLDDITEDDEETLIGKKNRRLPIDERIGTRRNGRGLSGRTRRRRI